MTPVQITQATYASVIEDTKAAAQSLATRIAEVQRCAERDIARYYGSAKGTGSSEDTSSGEFVTAFEAALDAWGNSFRGLMNAFSTAVNDLDEARGVMVDKAVTLQYMRSEELAREQPYTWGEIDARLGRWPS